MEEDVIILPIVKKKIEITVIKNIKKREDFILKINIIELSSNS